jgi:hypothetical protein
MAESPLVDRGSEPHIGMSSVLNPAAGEPGYDLVRAVPSVTRSGIPRVRRLERL